VVASADARRGTRPRRGFRPVRATGDAAARSHARGGAAARRALTRSVLGRAETGKHRMVARLGAALGFTLTPLVGHALACPDRYSACRTAPVLWPSGLVASSLRLRCEPR